MRVNPEQSTPVPIDESPRQDMFQVLDPNGQVVGAIPNLADNQLIELYRQLIRTRIFDERALQLQRTGRLPSYYPCAGQEAHVAIPMALEDRDWVFISYREQGVRLARGVPIINELAVWRGMPFATWDPREFNIAPVNVTIGTHLPHATGYGYGARLLKRDEVALAIFGDGATSESDFHAGLNFAGVWNTPTVFFCQNNLYAQSTPLAEQTAVKSLAQKAVAYGFEGIQVDGMDVLAVYQVTKEAVDKARTGGGPTLIEALCYRYTPHSTYDGKPVYRTREEEAEWRERDPLIRMRKFLESRKLLSSDFEDSVKEETQQAVESAIDDLEATDVPPRDRVFRSVYARLPKRFAEQLADEQRIAGESVTELSSEEYLTPGEEIIPTAETKPMTLTEALNAALAHEMEHRQNMVILGEDVGREGGIFRVTDGFYERFGKERMLDTPLCETGIVGTAVGMTIAGVKPVCEIEFAGFAYPTFDQIIYHVARFSWRSGRKITMPLIIRMPSSGGHEGLEGHSESPEAFFMHAPGGLIVLYPSNPIDAKGLMAAAMESDDPVIFFEPVAQYFVRQEGVPVDHYTIPIGKARLVREGNDVTIVTYGNAVYVVQEAAASLAEMGISVEIIDLRTLRPWDEETVLVSLGKTGRLVVVHEAPITGGPGAEIIARVSEKAADLLETPPVRVGHADLPWGPVKLEPYSMLAPNRVVQAARTVMAG